MAERLVAGAHIDGVAQAQFKASNLAVSPESVPPNLVFFPHSMDSIEARPLLAISSPDYTGPLLHRAHWPNRFESREEGIFRASERLKSLGAPRRLRNELFTRHGEFRHKDTSGKDVLAMDPDDAFEHIIEVLQPELEAIEYYLDEPNTSERPYNAHGEQHLRNTHTMSHEFLRNAGHIGKPDRFRKRQFKYDHNLGPEVIGRHGAIVAALHDVGYLVDPENHPFASIYLAEKIFPQLLAHPEDRKRHV